MPFIFSERLPVPALKSYCIVSVIVFAASLIYLRNVYASHHEQGEQELLHIILSEPFVLWSSVNIVYCCLFLLGKVIQRIVLGDLRVIEEQHLQDRFWNFIFYKFIFIFGVVNAQSLHDVLCWIAWFSVLGFLNIFSNLCKDRYEHNTSSPNTPNSTHVKLICLMTAILFSSFVLSVFAIKYGFTFGWNQFLFMLAECFIVGLKSLHMIVKYVFHLNNLLQTGLWDRKAKAVYYTNFLLKFLIHSLDLVFHFHMLIWSNVFLSMASLVLYWNIQSIFGDLKKMFKKHRFYKMILKSVDQRFPLATREELDKFEDHCAICWDNMDNARKLPCSHLFHHGCLCSWLEQDVSCPTCRRSLSVDVDIPQTVNQQDGVAADGPELQEIAENQRQDNNGGGLRNYFFYLDGQQIANWFPSFSIEVFHGRMDNQQLDEMAQGLYGMFPNVPRDVILEDLQRTRSVEATADNILEGNLATEAITPPEEENSALSSVPEERPQETFQPITAGNEKAPSEQPSDNESLIEDSSGTDDSTVQPSSLLRTDGSTNIRRLGPLTASNVQRRHGIKRNRTSTSSESLSEPSTENCQESDIERRNLLLEAIERRTASSNR